MRVEPLSTTQERRLIDYLDEKFLEVTRAYKKRSHPSTSLPTLSSYLRATHLILDLILQIPPVDPSTSLRTNVLLRLTGEIMSSIPGYLPDHQSIQELLSWLDDLDHAWLIVLRSQVWDLRTRTGVDIPPSQLDSNCHSSPMTQTERTRLRSLLITGTTALEEWLETPEDLDFGTNPSENDPHIEMDMQTRIDQLFSHTLTEMGLLHAGEAL